mgnify:CR=1 FL=1
MTTPDARPTVQPDQAYSRLESNIRLNSRDALALLVLWCGVCVLFWNALNPGEFWWTDESPDYNQHMAANTPYAAWFVSLGEEQA